jgi:tetratricopeptide (TPR) repeat protein
MKILGFDLTPGKDQFRIADADKHWVEENLRWLIEVYGYPNKEEEAVLLTPKFFPATLSEEHVSAANLSADLCELFGLSRDIISIEIFTDLRDSNNIPYGVEGTSTGCETEITDGAYKILVANALHKNPERLLHCLVIEFIRIRLTESQVKFDAGGDDTTLFLYLAGIYFGFGVLLARDLYQVGRSHQGMWETTWHYGSPMPDNVMAFSLATYANLTGDNTPEWRNEFKPAFKKLLERALMYVQENPNDLFRSAEVQANDLFNLSNEQSDRGDFEGAISTLQKILFITDDYVLKADVYNNIGYFDLRMKNYQQGVSNFRKALALGPEYGFANDNLGYALIMTGELEEGLSYIQKAQQTGNNDRAYTHRNMALYHQRKKQPREAEEFFRKAFAENTPVDLLEYHYAEFLMEQGEQEKAKAFFIKSAEKQEKEGMDKMKELGLD